MAAAHDKDVGHPDMDYAEHDSTYSLFITLTKITVVAVTVLLAAMAYFLV